MVTVEQGEAEDGDNMDFSFWCWENIHPAICILFGWKYGVNYLHDRWIWQFISAALDHTFLWLVDLQKIEK